LVSLAQMRAPEDLTWELVVVDNNSSDETKGVVELFARSSQLNVKYVFEGAAGLSRARNRGVTESEGGIISFLDDDVVVAPDWLIEICRAFEQYGAMCVGGRVLLQGDPQMPSWWHKSFDVAIGKFDRGDNVVFCENGDGELTGIGANISFRRIVFEKYGLFDSEMGRIGNHQHRTGEETDLVLRLRRDNQSAVYYPGAVVYHCVSNDRFTKRYLRMNGYHFGRSRYRLESEALSKSSKFLGVPLWMYRFTLAAPLRMIYLTLLRRRTEVFLEEWRAFVYLGYFMAARQSERSKETFPGR
jgi:GT2 family glycosyltransferase